MQVRVKSVLCKAFDIMYKESNEGEVVLRLGLALPASSTLGGSCTSVKTSVNGTSPGGLGILPEVERPDHKALLQDLSSN